MPSIAIIHQLTGEGGNVLDVLFVLNQNSDVVLYTYRDLHYEKAKNYAANSLKNGFFYAVIAVKYPWIATSLKIGYRFKVVPAHALWEATFDDTRRHFCQNFT
jgi:hypothetical protein